jgi:hypothetical protein
MSCLRWLVFSTIKIEPRSLGAEGPNFELYLPGHLSPRKDAAFGDLECTGLE